MKILQIEEWKAEEIANAIRLTINALERLGGEKTCLDRCLADADKYINEALSNPPPPE